jgi:uncharacterized membrane protein
MLQKLNYKSYTSSLIGKVLFLILIALDNNIKLETHNETFCGLCCVFVYGLVGCGFSLKTAAVVCLHSSSFQDFLDLFFFFCLCVFLVYFVCTWVVPFPLFIKF